MAELLISHQSTWQFWSRLAVPYIMEEKLPIFSHWMKINFVQLGKFIYRPPALRCSINRRPIQWTHGLILRKALLKRCCQRLPTNLIEKSVYQGEAAGRSLSQNIPVLMKFGQPIVDLFMSDYLSRTVQTLYSLNYNVKCYLMCFTGHEYIRYKHQQ